MEPIDTAFVQLQEYLSGDYSSVVGGLTTEADVRLKVVDPIFIRVLGWPIASISAEDRAGKGFIDYRFNIESLARLLAEAKRDGRDLGIADDRNGRFFKLNGPVFNTEASREGIEQAINYCGHKNAELACVTNGREWIIFRGNRLGDGRDTLDGLACAFASLTGIRDNFKLFFDLLSYDAVKAYKYRAIFREQEKQPVRTSSVREPLRQPVSRQLLPTDNIYADIDRIMVSFFRQLTGDEDPELLRACFVTSPESDIAEANLARISEELLTQIRELDTAEGDELTAIVRRVGEMRRKEFALLVGTKGAGKSTFIDRFFEDVLPTELAHNCVVIRVDLADSGGDDREITRWLDREVLKNAEKAIFADRPAAYDELQGMFFDEYRRWMEGSQKHLYETDKTEFKIKFGNYIEDRRNQDTHDYIQRLLLRVVRSEKKIPCLVFDNADHFTIEFQERVFQYAHSLYKNVLSLVIVPITDKTSWQLSRQGALQSFYTESFYLPTPSPQLVLLKRIEYIEQRLDQEKPEKGRGYFFGRGIELSIDDLRAFANCLQAVFIKSGKVSELIGNLSNYDIRRCLKLTQAVVTSPYIRVDELMMSYVSNSAVHVHDENARLAIIRGKYDIYPVGQNEFVQNMYALTTEVDTSPILGMRLLQLLDDTRHQEPDGESRYIAVRDVCDYFLAMSISEQVTRLWIDIMLKCGLCLSYDPRITSVDESVKIEISPAGRQHLLWGQKDWVYIESMLGVTPIADQDDLREIEQQSAAQHPHARCKAMQVFLRYLLKEDQKYCVVPEGQEFSGQRALTASINTEAEVSLASPVSLSESIRFGRTKGKVVRWNDQKGYGFVRPDGQESDVFVHANDVEGRRSLPVGARVAMDVKDSDRGLNGVAVAVIDK